MRPARALATNIDPQSRQVLQRLGWLFAIFALWSGAFGLHRPLVLFSIMTFAGACVEGAIAVFCREKLAADRLSRWDLAAALLGLHCLSVGLA
jgi:hypothetical protein